MLNEEARTVAMLVAVGALLIAVGIGLERLRNCVDRGIDRAPRDVLVSLLALAVVTLALLPTGIVPAEAVGFGVAGMTLVAAVWGWLRYRGSARVRRWEGIYDGVDHLLASDPEAADRLLQEAIKQDEAEREALRAAAPTDPKAAHEFRRRTRQELNKIGRFSDLTRHHLRAGREAEGLLAIADGRRQKLQADLQWIEGVLGRRRGAA